MWEAGFLERNSSGQLLRFRTGNLTDIFAKTNDIPHMEYYYVDLANILDGGLLLND